MAEFKSRLVENLLFIQTEIFSSLYTHGGYFHFKINDTKPRDIHKASVRDRVIHHALYSALYPYFDAKFIFDSYSCRLGKGTHKAIYRFEEFGKKESKNFTKTVWILKCDIRKCFASVDHHILKSILVGHFKDKRLFSITASIIDSFPQGLPLGNLTSQLFINIYLNELDLYVKHRMKATKYIRYADDFVIFSRDKNELLSHIFRLQNFLKIKLDFDMHPKKIFLKTLSSGVDFLGWVHFPNHRVLRTKTKKRMFRNLKNNPNEAVVSSYLGLLKHGDAHKLREKVKNML